MKKSVMISFCGVITALSVVLLYLGSVIWLFAYVVPILTGFLVEIMHKLFGTKNALLIYICVSIISLFVLPDKECALLYTLFFGYFPIIKVYLERINSKILSFVLKLIVFNISVVIAELICVYVFLIPLDNSFGKWGIIILLLLGNFVFILYDRLFLLFNVLWYKKYKNLFNKLLK